MLQHSEPEDRYYWGENLDMCWTTDLTVDCYSAGATMVRLCELFKTKPLSMRVKERGGRLSAVVFQYTQEILRNLALVLYCRVITKHRLLLRVKILGVVVFR